MADIIRQFFIPFSSGGGAIVDWDFQSIVHCFTWRKDKNGYAKTNTPRPNRKTIQMHRIIMDYPKEVDHINGKTNDNRLSNLRSVTRKQNMHNKVSHRNGRLLGTTLTYGKYWLAQTWINGKRKHIGSYKTEIEAHLAYKMYTKGL